MKKLFECVDMKYADGTFLLIPKQSCEIDLVMLGFNGTEKWIRLRCWQHKCQGLGNGSWEYEATICKADGHSWSWHWGFDGYTLVTDSVKEMQNKIVEACSTYCKVHRLPQHGSARGWW